MTEEKKITIAGDLRRLRRYFAIAGILLGIACHLVPAEYRSACDALASICSGVLP